jgi:hypothetical protein
LASVDIDAQVARRRALHTGKRIRKNLIAIRLATPLGKRWSRRLISGGRLSKQDDTKVLDFSPLRSIEGEERAPHLCDAPWLGIRKYPADSVNF